jgi:hypothetical protein
MMTTGIHHAIKSEQKSPRNADPFWSYQKCIVQ